jgi:hypothetical protein
MTAPQTPAVSGVGDTAGHFHRHAYPVAGTSGEHALSRCVYPDGHESPDSPCDNPHAVWVLDPRDLDTFRPLQAALDAQPHAGIRSLVHAVETLLAGRVS